MPVEKNPKNNLDNFDFCLRKAIAVHVFSKNNDDTLSEFAKALDTTQPMLSKWMSREVDEEGRITPTLESRHAPTAAQIILASAYLSMSVAEMIDEAIKGEEQLMLIPAGMLDKMKKLSKELHDRGVVSESKRAEKRAPEYLKKINRTANSRYIGFFLQDGTIGHLIIETYNTYKSGSVPMTARIIGKAGNPYRGNVVSPPGNDHLYFYIRQEDGKNDRGIMVFYIDDDMQDTYKCGSGILLSTDRKSGKVRLQWVVILRDSYCESPDNTDTMLLLQEIQERETEINQQDRAFEKSLEWIDEHIRPILEEEMPETHNSHIQFDNLRDRQEHLYEFYQKLYADDLELLEKRVKSAKARYDEAMAELKAFKKRN